MSDNNPTPIRAMVEAAIRAPSSHNTQPWRFRLGEGTIDLHADRMRALPVNDPHDRELTISCGAAPFNLRVAAAHAGAAIAVVPLPDQSDPDWLASVTLDAGAVEALADLWPALTERRTYRKRFGERQIESGVVDVLVDAAASEGALLHPVLAAAARRRVSSLVADGDRALWADRRWRRELALWMHPRRQGDGLTLPGLALPVAQLVIRTFDVGDGTAAKDQALTDGSPLIAILETTSDEARDWLAAGQALERVLLTACRQGLQASHLNQPVQVSALRSRLRALVGGTGVPQVVLRFGYPTGIVPGSVRRPVDAVIDQEPLDARVPAADRP